MILFLYGNDSFRSREKLIELRDAYLHKHPSSGLFEIDGIDDGENAVQRLAQALNEAGLFATKKLVIVKRLTEATEEMQEKMTAFLKEIYTSLENDTETVMIVWEEKTLQKTNELLKFLTAKNVKKQQFENLTGMRLEEWMIHRIHKTDARVRIEKRATAFLAAELGDDMYALENELRKLTDACDDGVIRETDVERFLSISVKARVFEALEALASGHRDQALALFEDQLKKGENALYLLSMCAWQLRNLLKVVEGYAEGMHQPAILAQAIKLHPFVVQKLLRQKTGFTIERIKSGFALLADLDTRSKNGSLDPKLALDLFVMKV